MADISIHKLNSSFIKVITSQGIIFEMQDEFAFFVDGYKFMPKFRNGIWDGKIRLMGRDGKIYAGLLFDIIDFANKYGYTFEIDKESFSKNKLKIKPDDISEFFKTLNKHTNVSEYTPLNYQIAALESIAKTNRALIVSPTGSGKSYIAYLMIRLFIDMFDSRILLVVPTTQLVDQMVSDFDAYSIDEFSSECHKIYSGKEKKTDLPVVVTTWQSVYRLDEIWFNQFDAVIVDEVHLADAASLKAIMEKCTNVNFRIGMTGTLKETSTSEMVLRGLFGPIFRTTTTKQLMDEGKLAQLEIDAVVLKYTTEECKLVSAFTEYEQEVQFLITHKKRNEYILERAMSFNTNTLVLFLRVDTHGKIIEEMARNHPRAKEKKIFLVYGSTDSDIRDGVRKIAEENNNVLIFASYGVFSTGVNIRNLHNVITAHPLKSRTKILQSIGRQLRTHKTKTTAILVDISDDLSHKRKLNFSFKQFVSRIKLFEENEFKYVINQVQL